MKHFMVTHPDFKIQKKKQKMFGFETRNKIVEKKNSLFLGKKSKLHFHFCGRGITQNTLKTVVQSVVFHRGDFPKQQIHVS